MSDHGDDLADTDHEMTDIEEYTYSDGGVDDAADDAEESQSAAVTGTGAAASTSPAAAGAASSSSSSSAGAGAAASRPARSSLGMAQNADYRIIQEDEIKRECGKVVNDVAGILAVEPDCATMLLIAFK